VGCALFFVVYLQRDGIDGTAPDTDTAASISKKETVDPGIGTSSRCRGDDHVRDNAATAMGYPLFGYDSVFQAEGAEAGDISGVALRPGRGVLHLVFFA
jgi:hypothetical protein